MHSFKAQQLADEFLRSKLCQHDAIQSTFGAPVLFGVELLDLYELATDAQRRLLFPLLEPTHYRSLRELDGAPENLLVDFFEVGIASELSPHPLIQIDYMRSLRPDLFQQDLEPRVFFQLLAGNLVDPGPFFDTAYYKAVSTEDLFSGSALVDYMFRGAVAGLNPNKYFDAEFYRKEYEDVPSDNLLAAYHFLAIGDAEARRPSGVFDPHWYRERYLLDEEGIECTLIHFLKWGRFEGRSPTQRDETGTPVVHERLWDDGSTSRIDPKRIEEAYLQHRALLSGPRVARLSAFKEKDIRPVTTKDAEQLLSILSFTTYADPLVDVLIPCFNEFEKTVECLASIARAAINVALRIMLIDDCSEDPRYSLFKNVQGIDYVRNPNNLHFLLSCNEAAKRSSAPYLLLLNNDTQIVGRAIDVLVRELEEDSGVAVVVPKILYPNGRLQEAGGTVLSNGDTRMVGVGDDPERPEYCRSREVLYGSGACMVIRRSAIGETLFDERFAPAYCEDVDLCLRVRDLGYRVRYVADAEVVHHLSASTSAASEIKRVQLARRNQQKLYEKWGSRLLQESEVRVLAFYLPQFHPVKENDLWWGKGFTDWFNVIKAIPSFPGHYQPHLPSDLGFYDLRLPEIMEQQQSLARRYGITGFVMYYYNFKGRRILGKPLENLLSAPDMDFNFCLCWANENWTKHWDGGTKGHALLTQDYDQETILNVLEDVIAAAGLPSAITINGMPLFIIYRPLLIPNLGDVCSQIRDAFDRAGFRGVHLAYVESMETVNKVRSPGDLGFDSSIEFPPQGIAEKYDGELSPTKPGFHGKVYDYGLTTRNAVNRSRPRHLRFPSVFPSWDNTPRQPMAHTTLFGASPELFQAYVEAKLDEVDDFLCGEERILFVNAWNEWAEGAHLEPDQQYEHDWLRAIGDALDSRSSS